MGGFTGSDNAPSPEQLDRWRSQGALGFVLSRAPGPQQSRHTSSPTAQARTAWVQQNCTPVPPSSYGGTGQAASPMQQRMSGGAQVLYSCRN